MLREIFRFKHNGATIGFTASTFELLHAGHIAMLAEAKQKCDKLIVGLLTDPTISRPGEKNKPVQSIFERYLQLQAVKYVDYIIPFDTEDDLEDMLKLLKPTIRFVGEEYKNQEFTGKNIEGIRIYYNTREHSFSSSDLRKRVQESKNK